MKTLIISKSADFLDELFEDKTGKAKVLELQSDLKNAKESVATEDYEYLLLVFTKNERHCVPEALEILENVEDIFEIDRTRRIVKSGEATVSLTELEFRLFEHFMARKGELIKMDQLRSHLYGSDIKVKNAVATHLGNLKKKLPAFGKKIHNVRGRGYIFKL